MPKRWNIPKWLTWRKERLRIQSSDLSFLFLCASIFGNCSTTASVLNNARPHPSIEPTPKQVFSWRTAKLCSKWRQGGIFGSKQLLVFGAWPNLFYCHQNGSVNFWVRRLVLFVCLIVLIWVLITYFVFRRERVLWVDIRIKYCIRNWSLFAARNRSTIVTGWQSSREKRQTSLPAVEEWSGCPVSVTMA